MPKVSITKTENDFYAAFSQAITDMGKPLITPGDRVLIKPNLVEPAAPDSGQITNPKLIEAVARYCLDYGAGQVVIGEGPGFYQPRSCFRECFTHTGVSYIAENLGVEWILFDEHRYHTFKGVSECTPEEFRITEFAFNCDKFINLPVLKTHYLTTVTLAMKNLKGCLKREDKPLFHHHDLSLAVVELCQIIRPTINVIDCTSRNVVRQLGTGYTSEHKQARSGLLIVSPDIVAVDAVSSALMGIDPMTVRTVYLGTATGLGSGDLTRMDIVGEELRQLIFTVKLPQEELQYNFPLLQIVGEENACSGCLIPLVSNLLYLHEQGIELERPLSIGLGKHPEIPEDMALLLVGDCTQSKGNYEYDWVEGCPPDRELLLRSLVRNFT
jgi:uncharacterized protein (DUF362 family)